jgi:hypothetical protein
MTLLQLRTLIPAFLLVSANLAFALSPADIASAASCNKAAAAALTDVLMSDDKVPDWLTLVEATSAGSTYKSKKPILAFGSTFRQFNWFSTQVSTFVFLLIDRNEVASFAREHKMKPLPGSILRMHYRVEDDGRILIIHDQLDENGKRIKQASVGCSGGNKDEQDFIEKTRRSEQFLKQMYRL